MLVVLQTNAKGGRKQTRKRKTKMSEWWTTTVSICLGVTAVISLINLITGIIKDHRKPTDDIEKRVSDIEKKLDYEMKAIFESYEVRFKNDKARLDTIEEGNRVTQRAIRALLRHSIDGNNTEGLIKAEADLSEYLIDR